MVRFELFRFVCDNVLFNLGPVKVSISVIVLSFGGADSAAQTFTANVLFVQRWIDPGLNVSGVESRVTTSQPSFITSLWKPNLYFVNGRSVSLVNSLRPAQTVTVDSTGEITFYQRVSGDFDCFLNLQNFPMDVQYCRFIVSPCKLSELKVYSNSHYFTIIQLFTMKPVFNSNGSNSLHRTTFTPNFASTFGTPMLVSLGRKVQATVLVWRLQSK